MLEKKPSLGAIAESHVQRMPAGPLGEDHEAAEFPDYSIAEARKREAIQEPETKDAMSGSIRMAKARKEDMDTVFRLMHLVDAIGDGYYPSNEEGAPTFFDDDDREHLQALCRKILEIAENSGGIHRVVGAASIILNPQNNLIDPDDNCIELSPDLKAAQKAAELWEYFQGFIRAHGAGSITDLVVQRDNLQAENKILRNACKFIVGTDSPIDWYESARQALHPEEGNHG